MLTKESLQSISGLTEEQLQAITTLSKNDEEVTIGRKVKEIHDRYDQDIEAITGVPKSGGVKSYENLKQQMSGLMLKASDVETLKNQLQTLQSEATNLKGSPDAALTAQLETLKLQLTDKENEIKTIRTNAESEKQTLQEQLTNERNKSTTLEVNRTIDSHMIEKGIKFKTTIPESMRTRMIEVEKQSMLNEYKPDYIENGAGGQKLVFRNQENEIVRNRENNNEPATAADLFLQRSSISEMIDSGRQQNGTGTQTQASSSGGVLDLSGAKNQIEADAIIREHIMKVEGIPKTDVSFVERQQEIRTENNVANMDVR